MCAEIELSVKETAKGINAICHPRVDALGNIFRRWNLCLLDDECFLVKHPIGGKSQNMSGRPVIMLTLHPVKPSDLTFVATVMYGNISTGNFSAISLACGVTRSEGLVWSQPVQIRPQITGNPPTTVPSNSGEHDLYMYGVHFDFVHTLTFRSTLT